MASRRSHETPTRALAIIVKFDTDDCIIVVASSGAIVASDICGRHDLLAISEVERESTKSHIVGIAERQWYVRERIGKYWVCVRYL